MTRSKAAKHVRDLMISLADYAQVPETATLRDAIVSLRAAPA
ncbi:MAG: hypothetical protein ABIK09_14175 [Pseudomonadota bacterium]